MGGASPFWKKSRLKEPACTARCGARLSSARAPISGYRSQAQHLPHRKALSTDRQCPCRAGSQSRVSPRDT